MPRLSQSTATIALVYGHLLDVGGVETHLLSLLRHGNIECYRWLILAPVSPSFRMLTEALGAQIIPWQVRHPLDIVALLRLVRWLREYRVDLVHTHSPRAAFLGRLAARLLRRPVIVTVHLPPYYFFRGHSVRSRFMRWLYRWNDRILNHSLTDRLIYVSSYVCQEALDQRLAPRERTTIIKNGIELTSFNDGKSKASLRQAWGISPDTILICCVCRLDVQKGVDVLLEAIHLLSIETALTEWQVWIVGDGPQRSTLENQVRQLRLGKVVQFLGLRGDVSNLLRASDVFVLPSRYEAMPMAVLEAMAAGLPSVVTRVGENPFLIENETTGFVVPPEDPHALGIALRKLVEDLGLRHRMGRIAQQRARDYDAAKMAQRIQSLYATLLSDNQDNANTK